MSTYCIMKSKFEPTVQRRVRPHHCTILLYQHVDIFTIAKCDLCHVRWLMFKFAQLKECLQSKQEMHISINVRY